MATPPSFPTINVVPAGFRWNTDAADTARAKGAFLRVGGNQVTRRYLSGADRSWNSENPEENQTIFHTGYRITGTPDSIRTALQYAQLSPEEIDNVIATAITRDNYASTKAQEVEEEIKAHSQAKQAKPVEEGYGFKEILWFGERIDTAVIATKTGAQKGHAAYPGRGGAGDTLAEKIEKLGQGKVLDVSNMDINTGKGVRTVPAPKTSKSGKFGTDNIPIISNDLNKYTRAIELAYGTDGVRKYVLDIEVVKQALANIGVPVATMGGLVTVQGTSPADQKRKPGAPNSPIPQLTEVQQVLSPFKGLSPAGKQGATNSPLPPFTGVPQVISPLTVPSPAYQQLPGATIAPIPQFTEVPKVISPLNVPSPADNLRLQGATIAPIPPLTGVPQVTTPVRELTTLGGVGFPAIPTFSSPNK